VEDRTQLPTRLAENGFPSSFGHEHHVTRTPRDTCSPILNGIGSDKALTLHPLLVVHQATWSGVYSRNGQTSSSLTGRTSGLPIESPNW
jgi:hypothetical protein